MHDRRLSAERADALPCRDNRVARVRRALRERARIDAAAAAAVTV